MLLEYGIVFMTRKAIKGSVIASHLADHAVEDYEPLDFDLPDDDVLVIGDDEGRVSGGHFILMEQ